jgi:hypothetical protein
MTTLMFSLTLGFIIFLNIVVKIPFYKEQNDLTKGVGYTTINLGRYNQPKELIDIFVKRYDHVIESFGTYTHYAYNIFEDIYMD